ncbi:amidohydrolase [Nocardia sp. SYP-A9097]|uniref:amidohydrolase n=1 Tax=Nocardia sp. SYP-A9097 TaxID=2663237 RepID=UPI00129AD679|nr:amidohydrolase [Nocardia sp. SYP-A9097]MRH90830.1 amidohydrolase [Nocardia sp. SYP-A9097]
MTEHWQQVYRQLHAHPELSGEEHGTASLVAEELRALDGWEVTPGVGGTGVVGVLQSGPGPIIWLRADMDALPVQEETGLEYASRTAGVMHACGHDTHVAALLAACAQLSADRPAGTVVAVFQPAEETGAGAQRMLDDGLLQRFPKPGIVLGQHVAPLPAGFAISKSGPIMAASDSIRVKFTGRGGHGSQPHLAVDPLLMAASFVVRMQSLTARQAAVPSGPVLVAGSLHAGTRPNIIAETAELLLTLRTFSDTTRDRMLEDIARLAQAEAEAAGAPVPPEFAPYDHFPVTVNTEGDTERIMATLTEGGIPVMPLTNPLTGSEDFGAFGTAARCPSVFWHIGGIDAARFTEADQALMLAEHTIPPRFPSNHSPRFAPDPGQTLPAMITAMVTAARAELARS